MGVIVVGVKKIYSDDEKSEDDTNVYSKGVRESLLDNDELSPVEEAFLSGYEDAI